MPTWQKCDYLPEVKWRYSSKNSMVGGTWVNYPFSVLAGKVMHCFLYAEITMISLSVTIRVLHFLCGFSLYIFFLFALAWACNILASFVHSYHNGSKWYIFSTLIFLLICLYFEHIGFYFSLCIKNREMRKIQLLSSDLFIWKTACKLAHGYDPKESRVANRNH